MGRKGKWFVAIKKAFSHEPKEKKEQKNSNSKNNLSEKKNQEDRSSSQLETTPVSLPPSSEEVKLTEIENDQSKHAYSAPVVTTTSATAEVVRLTNVSRYSGKTKEEVAAIKIQTAFRGYLARRALRALKGLVRLKALIDGQSVKRQANTTLRCMQTLARVQSQIRARRIRMSEENQALQKQLQSKSEKELETLKDSMGEDWDDSAQSKEQIEAKLLNKHEAAIRRERALAYAFSHQQALKNSARSGNPTFMDPNNPHWGWSWLERWMAARPWESRNLTDKDFSNDQVSMKSTSQSIGGEITKAYAHRELNPDKPSPVAKKVNRITNRQSPSTPPSRAALAGKMKPASPRGAGSWTPEEDSRSMSSMQSEKVRRHSVAGPSVRDDESSASSPALPSYMAATASAKARTRLQSPLGVEKPEMTPDRGPLDSSKKRLSFTGSPKTGLQRRHSGPPKVDIADPPMKDIVMHTEQQSVSNGGESR